MWEGITGEKVKQVEMGQYHSAIIDENGKLFTFGYGLYGQLGHNQGERKSRLPQQLDFFSKNNLKVKQVRCLDRSTLALTEDGDVWSWGFGGRSTSWVTNIFFQPCGALGHNEIEHRFAPTPIELLRKNAETSYICGGSNFAFSMNKAGEIWNWGAGEYGVFGDGKNKNFYEPTINDTLMNIGDLEDTDTPNKALKLLKIKSAMNYSVGLGNDNKLYAWGSNDNGQMGTNNEIGVEMYETNIFPIKVNTELFTCQEIVDFSVGEDTLAIHLADGNVFWAGMRLTYQPNRLALPEEVVGKVTSVTAGYRSIAVLTDDNQIYMRNKYVNHHQENIDTGIFQADASKLFDGRVIKMGGQYRNHYAIVEKH